MQSNLRIAQLGSPLSAGNRKFSLNSERTRGGRLPRLVRAALGVPLAGKLAGANALIVIAAVTALFSVHDAGASEREMIGVVIVVLVMSLMLNLVLVHFALLPIRALGEAATRITEGDLDARVALLPLADPDIARTGRTFNFLLDRFITDRARVRELAAQVIRAGDEERSRIARQLHDSTAQTLTALSLQARSVADCGGRADVALQLDQLRRLSDDAIAEVRALSQTMHSRVLEDLGLRAALNQLARVTREREVVEIVLQDHGETLSIPRPIASVLYRVAEEGLSNAIRHGAPHMIRITLDARNGTASLEIADDGHGFDAHEARNGGVGLFVAQERLALVDGTLRIESAPGHGARVSALVPLNCAGS